MHLKKDHSSSPGKSLFAALLIGLVLLLNAMAAMPVLHELIHHDASKADHQCGVTLFAHGKVQAASGDVPIVKPIVVIRTSPVPVLFVFSPTFDELPPGRAPPSVVSPQA